MLLCRRICSTRLLRCAYPTRAFASTRLNEESHQHHAPKLGQPEQKDKTAETSVNPINPQHPIGITSGQPSTYTGRHVRIAASDAVDNSVCAWFAVENRVRSRRR